MKPYNAAILTERVLKTFTDRKQGSGTLLND
jgi:hypothetical protein